LPEPLAEIAAELERQRTRLIEALGGLDAAQTTRSPDPGEWNVAQMVDHLLLAEGFTNDITGMLVDRAADAGEATGFPAELRAFTPPPEPRSLEAPPPIRPRRELGATELMAALTAMSKRTHASFAKLATVDPRRLKMEHPLFGELDLAQWWMVNTIHYGMHIEQAHAALGTGA
jgi:hypothetical protein